MITHADPKVRDAAAIRRVTPADYPYFIDKLQALKGLVRARILETLARSESERAGEIAGQVHDLKDDAFADRLAELGIVEMSRELAEIQDIAFAERRLQLQTYDGCLDCGEGIGWQRLDASPTAKRCISCEQRRERSPITAALP